MAADFKGTVNGMFRPPQSHRTKIADWERFGIVNQVINEVYPLFRSIWYRALIRVVMTSATWDIACTIDSVVGNFLLSRP